MSNKAWFSLTDVFAGIFILLLISTVGVSAAHNAKADATRLQCRSNLYQLGIALMIYSSENKSHFPQTLQDTTGKRKPVWGTPYETNKNLSFAANANAFDGGKTTPAANDVSASLYLLLRVQKLEPKIFVCPSTPLSPWDFGGKEHKAAEWTNWQGNDGLSKHLSYSYLNVFVTKDAIARGFDMSFADAMFPVIADMNPGGDGVTKVTIKSSEKDLASANSLNHGREGQNVLYWDGHAEFQSTPFCGLQRDNIYTAAGPEIKGPARKAAVIVSSPVDAMDSVLLPTAMDIGYKGQPQ